MYFGIDSQPCCWIYYFQLKKFLIVLAIICFDELLEKRLNMQLLLSLVLTLYSMA
ncbi:hypothetical protein RT0154 [Rickettsia typhi str. Wilmington]|uniref:Uncharacterized protein n=1 Tax=Rickettsia typhi (strain ATCC VR-144 / Wilmington) TaxID=257363 RepID=Q68XK4_RICTY|nr:hypothetical protein RT0154 [Rickettsia typhi str. Wilmington]